MEFQYLRRSEYLSAQGLKSSFPSGPYCSGNDDQLQCSSKRKVYIAIYVRELLLLAAYWNNRWIQIRRWNWHLWVSRHFLSLKLLKPTFGSRWRSLWCRLSFHQRGLGPVKCTETISHFIAAVANNLHYRMVRVENWLKTLSREKAKTKR